MAEPFEENAKALQEAAKATGKAVDLLGQAGSYLAAVAGDLPKNLVGIVADQIAHFRVRRLSKLIDRTEEILSKRDPSVRKEVAPVVLIPILEGAQDVDDERLSDMWANLLANAADADRSKWVRLEFIETIKQLNPLDAAILNLVQKNTADMVPSIAGYYAHHLEVSEGLADISIGRLQKLECVYRRQETPNRLELTTYGRMLLSACGA